MRGRLGAAALAALLLGTVPVRTQSRWTYAGNQSFEVYTTGGERTARDALVYFERVRAFFDDFLKLSPRSGAPTRLIIFSNAKEYAPYRPNEFATGFYQPGPDQDYIVMRSFNADSFPMVVHEYAHLVFRHGHAAYPPWLNEGLAEFFSTLGLDMGQARLGRVPMSRLDLLTGNRLIPIPRLFAIDHESPEYNSRQHAGVFYSESWALTHMLLTEPAYQAKTPRFLEAMAGGADGTQTIQTVYGETPASLQKALTSYVNRASYRYFVAPYKAAKDAPVTARPVTPFEGGLVTANLLAVTRDREADARAAFDALAREQSDSLPLAESRAFFEARRQLDATTGPRLARAIELGSRSAELHRMYASVIEADDPARAETLLRAAVSMEPDHVDGRLSLAELQFRRREPEEALRTIASLTRVPPADAFRFFRLEATANAMLDRLDEASTAAARMQQYARPGREADYAAEVARSIDTYLARRRLVDRALREAAEPASPPDARNATTGSPSVAPPKPREAPLTPGEVLGDDPALYVEVSGRLRNLVCSAGSPVLEIASGGTVVRVVIDNPVAVRVLGRTGPETELTCGAQDVPIKVSYQPKLDPSRRTSGNVRVLDFRR